ncbi:hypothetical protein SAMN06295970_101594 [Noviherbaspirillum suwonense]|uniref:Transposase n=1 Tax=Noviherbaspirillum suwonense TaxID=1224511 RepID=A0ABY1PSS7_9BURK|nr:hypothetical protein SAMN06295970_101594 [Noviherbaspirillum suwonense]
MIAENGKFVSLWKLFLLKNNKWKCNFPGLFTVSAGHCSWIDNGSLRVQRFIDAVTAITLRQMRSGMAHTFAGQKLRYITA